MQLENTCKMTTWTDTTKNSTSWTDATKSTTTFVPEVKTGYGWTYNEEGITYSGALDSNTGNTVFYNSEGVLSRWTNQSK